MEGCLILNRIRDEFEEKQEKKISSVEKTKVESIRSPVSFQM